MDLFDHSGTPHGMTRRYFKPLMVLVALVLALGLTVRRRGPHGSVDVGAGETLRAAPNHDNRPYDLAALRIFNNTLMRVNDTYVDPTRVDPKEMLLAALDQVQKSVAEVLVEPKKEQNKVVVRVDTAQQEFAIGDVDSPWALSMRMKEIFKFIAQHLQSDTDAKAVREIEYAATNGMLSTLDPHSMLLDPEMYADMRMKTRGSFGGLGIVIGIRKGELTVIKPMPGTPAAEAGIKALDRIVRIDRESTINMMINDAVSRLRGDPDTKVEIWVRHVNENDSAARKVVLKRAVIQTHTVMAHMLKNNIGYVKLYDSFGGNTDDELRRAMDDLKSKGMKALVFDLRNNPGGLLDQAIKVTDEFVDSGTIVTTVGYANKQREEKRATPGGQPHVPMALLVNRGSASASEIVAGALKNLDRAVVIGSRTFGKGSVQVLSDNDDGSALKLTIAQYLTPGDVSIQSVGITPDVELDKVIVDKDKGVWLWRDNHQLSESDLDAHLKSTYTKTGEKPFETIKYLTPEVINTKGKKRSVDTFGPADENGDDEEEPPVEEEELPTEDQFVMDYDIGFAADLLAQAKGWRRREVLASSKPYFDKRMAEEQSHVVDALKKLSVDWTPVDGSQAPSLVGSVTTDHAQNQVNAGETIKFTAKITNKGPALAGQVRATLKGDDPMFEGREFVFGRIKAGETRSFVVPIKIPKDALSRVDPLHLEVNEQHGAKTQLEAMDMTVKVDGPQRPAFSYAYQVIDDAKGDNGDGLIQRGETVRLRVTVKNVGHGKSNETLAQLRNLSDEGVYINKGRFNVDNLQPGESKSVDFTFDVRPEYHGDNVKVEMTVYDTVLHDFVTDRLTFPVVDAKTVGAASGKVAVTTKADIRGGASKDAPLVGVADKGATFELSGDAGEFWRVKLDANLPGFIAKTVTHEANGGGAVKVAFTPAWQVEPPVLTVQAGAPLVDTSSIHVNGVARADHKITDMFIFVSNHTAKIDRRKVFYQSNHKATNPNEQQLNIDVPLWPGANVVTVVARESPQVQSQTTLIVQRREPRVATETHAKPEQPIEPGKSVK